jgi:hypothetical protein
MFSRSWTLMSLALLWGCAAAQQQAQVQATPAAGVVQWGDGAPSIEAQIEAHLASKELIVQREERGGQEAVLLAYEGQRVPDFLVAIRANKEPQLIGDRGPARYLVVVYLRTYSTIPESRTQAVLEALNVYNSEWAYGAFFLAQGEIAGAWPIRVDEGYPLHLDAIYDAVVMLVHNWRQLHSIVLPAQTSPDAPAEDGQEGEEEDAAPLPKGIGPVTRAARGPQRSLQPEPRSARLRPARW